MKAKSRGSKLRLKRGGRPRLVGAIRTADGTISEGSGERTRRAEVMTETATEARRRVFGMSADEARQPEAGSVLGRLYQDGSLGPVLKKQGTSWFRLKAGERYAEDMMRYYSLTGIRHPCGKAQNILAVRGYDGDEPDSRTEATRKAVNKMLKLETCMMNVDVPGRHVMASVYSVCLMDLETARGWHVTQIRHLVRGLDALVKFYEIG